MEQYSEAFHQPPGLMILQLLLPYLQLYMGGLNLERQAHHLLAQLEDGKSSEAEPECQEAWGVYIRVLIGQSLVPEGGMCMAAVGLGTRRSHCPLRPCPCLGIGPAWAQGLRSSWETVWIVCFCKAHIQSVMLESFLL